MRKLTWIEKTVFVVGVMLWLLAPAILCAQHKIDNWDVVRDGYYKVVVAGDTLPDNFTRYDTAVKFAYDYAEDSAQGQEIRILSPSYRFDYEYLELTDAELGSLLLKDLNWQHSQNVNSDEFTVSITAESIADSVRFQYYGDDSTGTLIDTVHWQKPTDGLVSDTLRTMHDVLIQVQIEAYYNTDYYEKIIQVNADVIGGILDVKKKRMA